MAQPKATQEQKMRFVTLCGMGLTQHEAARAVQVSSRTGERWLRDPQARKQVEQLRRDREDIAGVQEVATHVNALLNATYKDKQGEEHPDNEARTKGSELLLKHIDIFRKLAGDAPADDVLPEGVIEIYPVRKT